MSLLFNFSNLQKLKNNNDNKQFKLKIKKKFILV